MAVAAKIKKRSLLIASVHCIALFTLAFIYPFKIHHFYLVRSLMKQVQYMRQIISTPAGVPGDATDWPSSQHRLTLAFLRLKTASILLETIRFFIGSEIHLKTVLSWDD